MLSEQPRMFTEHIGHLPTNRSKHEQAFFCYESQANSIGKMATLNSDTLRAGSYII